MQEVLVNCLFKLAQEKVGLELTIAVDLARKGTKGTKHIVVPCDSSVHKHFLVHNSGIFKLEGISIV